VNPPHAARAVHIALMATVMVWGLNLTAVKLLTSVLDVQLVALVRMLMAAAFLAVVLSLRGGGFSWRGRELGLALAAAACMVYAQQLLFAGGLARTSATNAGLLMALGPVVSVLLECAVFRKRLVLRQIAGVTLAGTGVAAVVLARPDARWTSAALGDLLIFVSLLTFACGGLLVQRLARTRSSLSISTFLHLAGAGMLLVHTVAVFQAPMTALAALGLWPWVLIAFSGVVATALGGIAWARGISSIGVGHTATYLAWIPVFGAAFGVLLLDETFTRWHLAGIAAVLVGTTLALRSR
jgi:drug/metabolite transporter (DMT)-like permease